ncbi:hypothetical protein E3J38_01350 [candidate division TA06 bacterium]|uniref:Uncharacterized protein n=1 Tax=candidate division TA06 bacterium TaxID=2250710 RepID=A0A523XVR5_UNCT6|nr:MAG: hypothetical protein E3J38_01350 [candidate division TA06 bacterium]
MMIKTNGALCRVCGEGRDQSGNRVVVCQVRPKREMFASSAASGWVRESFSAEVQERAMMGSSFRSVEPVGPSAGRGLRVVEGCDAEATPFPR